MPKLKTKCGAKKRFKATKSKFCFYKTKHSHMLSNKNFNKKRQLTKKVVAHTSDTKKIKVLLPYKN